MHELLMRVKSCAFNLGCFLKDSPAIFLTFGRAIASRFHEFFKNLMKLYKYSVLKTKIANLHPLKVAGIPLHSE